MYQKHTPGAQEALLYESSRIMLACRKTKMPEAQIKQMFITLSNFKIQSVCLLHRTMFE